MNGAAARVRSMITQLELALGAAREDEEAVIRARELDAQEHGERIDADATRRGTRTDDDSTGSTA